MLRTVSTSISSISSIHTVHSLYVESLHQLHTHATILLLETTACVLWYNTDVQPHPELHIGEGGIYIFLPHHLNTSDAIYTPHYTTTLHTTTHYHTLYHNTLPGSVPHYIPHLVVHTTWHSTIHRPTLFTKTPTTHHNTSVTFSPEPQNGKSRAICFKD